MGSGTTAQVALELGREAIGYELNPDFLPLIEARLAPLLAAGHEVKIHRREETLVPAPVDYVPALPDLRPLSDAPRRKKRKLYRVTAVLGARRLQLADEREITLLGLAVPPERVGEAETYLETYLLGKRVELRTPLESAPDAAYVYLKNRLFVNRKMIEMGLAEPEETTEHPYREKFRRAGETRE